MRARVVNYPAGPVVAFGGFEFVKYEWRDVPAGFEVAAKEHPFLEVQEQQPEPEPIETLAALQFKALKVAELREIAEDLDIDTKGMKKADLIAALEELV